MAAVIGAVLAACISAPPAAGQSVWELTPYRVQVLLAPVPRPELDGRLEAELAAGLTARLDALVGAAWEVTVTPAPPALRHAADSSIEAVTVEQLPKESLEFDKVMLTAVSPAPEGYRLTVRELDVRTRLLGTPASRTVGQLAKLRDAALAAMLEAFAPLTRIERVEDKQVVLRVKAGAMRWREEGLLVIRPGDVFRPVIRYNDREGKLRRTDLLAWTFLTVEEVKPQQLGCLLHTGLRTPLSGRRRGRVEQLALAVIPPQRPSTLTLQSRSEPKKVLAGYDVYARPPESKTATLLGRTDRRGAMTVPAVEHPLRVLVVKHGGELLARLPIVPGMQPALIASIPNDDERLQAEGFITGMQEELVDLVTRRQVLIARTRARIKAKSLDEAGELMAELHQLQKAGDEFTRALSSQQKRLVSTDRAVQRKIDTLFADTQKLIDLHLSPRVIEEVSQELTRARGEAGG